MTHKTAALTIQKWGNSLAVRIPAALARIAHFYPGTEVKLDANEGTIVIEAMGFRKLTLAERLIAFDPEKHSGEAMSVNPVGLEKTD